MRASHPFFALVLLTQFVGCASSGARRDAGAAARQTPDAGAATTADASDGSRDAAAATGIDAGGGPLEAGASNQQRLDASTADAADRSPDTGAVNSPSPDVNDGAVDAGPASGEGLRPIACGERWMHDTTVHGQANTLRSYGCTARAESGRETLYAFRSPDACRVSARLDELQTDLDLVLLGAADERTCRKASATPLDLQRGEQLVFDAPADSTHVLVVDGYARNAGSYTLALDCLCGAAAASFDDGTWSLQVDRRWNGNPARVASPATELSDSDYSPVSDASAHDLVVSNGWREVSIGTAPWLGAIAKGTPGKLRYELATGTVAGGRFVVWSSARGLEAELTLYGSGVPIVSSERGRLVRKP